MSIMTLDKRTARGLNKHHVDGFGSGLLTLKANRETDPGVPVAVAVQ